MANDRPAESLAYEGINAASPDMAWRLLRLALILWASIVLIRHASYWGGLALDGGLVTSAMADPRPLLFAALDAGVLVTLLTLVVPARTAPASLKPIARLAAIFIAANLLSFVIDLFSTRGLLDNAGLRFVWLVASRVQLLVVPAVAIAAWRWSRKNLEGVTL